MMSCRKKAPSTLPERSLVWKAGSTRPWTTGLAARPTQAEWERTPGTDATFEMSEVSGVGMLTITSLALTDWR